MFICKKAQKSLQINFGQKDICQCYLHLNIKYKRKRISFYISCIESTQIKMCKTYWLWTQERDRFFDYVQNMRLKHKRQKNTSGKMQSSAHVVLHRL